MVEKYGKIVFKGASGNGYEFHAFSTNVELKQESGVYIFAKRYMQNGTTYFKPLYIGEAESLRDRICGHDKWDRAVSHGCNCICAMLVSGDKARLDVETDLRHNYPTPCNDQ